MESTEDFRKYGYQLIDHIVDYFKTIDNQAVKSKEAPSALKDQLPLTAPEKAESMDDIIYDFNQIIKPGITHWQHPNFHAYFPANNSFPSILGELLTAAYGVQGMIWETSPAAAELEEVVLNWLRQAMNLPSDWSGVIQDTASTASLVALLTAREKASNFAINKKGFKNQTYRVYASDQAHSSIEKAVKIAGIGSENLVKIPVDDQFSIQINILVDHIQSDLKMGYQPLMIVGALGTTGTVAIDDMNALGKLASQYNLWFHVDAAYAGSALLLPEFRAQIMGLELADSFVFNPHKWMFTNFDLSAYYVKDKNALINTFSILPPYLNTSSYGQVNDYRDWGVQLGRRFRALKLWFVLRSFGLERIRDKMREHIRLAEWFENQVINSERFELLTPRQLNVVVFRAVGRVDTNGFNALLMNKVNQSGEIYLSHTQLNDKYALRMVIGNTRVEMKHVKKAWEVLMHMENEIEKAYSK